MNKVEKFEGSWTSYYDLLSKLITKETISKNRPFLEECHKWKAMPEKAVKWL